MLTNFSRAQSSQVQVDAYDDYRRISVQPLEPFMVIEAIPAEFAAISLHKSRSVSLNACPYNVFEIVTTPEAR